MGGCRLLRTLSDALGSFIFCCRRSKSTTYTSIQHNKDRLVGNKCCQAWVLSSNSPGSGDRGIPDSSLPIGASSAHDVGSLSSVVFLFDAHSNRPTVEYYWIAAALVVVKGRLRAARPVDSSASCCSALDDSSNLWSRGWTKSSTSAVGIFILSERGKRHAP